MRILKAFYVVIAGVGLVAGSGLPALALPVKPANVTVENKSLAGTGLSDATVGVSWVKDDSAVGYSVVATTATTSKSGSTPSCTATLCTSTVSQLQGGVEYQFVVSAVALDTSTSSADAVPFTARSIPAAPTVGTATVSNGEVVLTWTPPTNTGGVPITGYVISGTNQFTSMNVAADKTSATATGLSSGAQYTFTIKAKNSLGSSAGSSFSEVTVAGVPSTPAKPTVSGSGSSISVSWVAPADNGSPITSYKVYLVDSNGTNVGTEQSVTTTSATITSVAVGTYTIRYIAINALGNSLPSPDSSAVVIAAGNQANVPVFTPNALGNIDVGATQAVSVAAPSGGDVSITVADTSTVICSYENGTLTALAPGTCSITASALATGSYAAGSASRAFIVKSPQSITFAPISSKVAGTTLDLDAVATSGLSVRYTVSGSCSITGSTVSFASAGTCNVTAAQTGNANYSAAQSVARAIEVTAAPGSGSGSGGGGGGGGTVIPKPNVPIVPSVPVVSNPTAKDYFLSSTSRVGAVKVGITKAFTTTNVSLGKKVYVTLTKLKKGTTVKTSIRTFDGKIFNLPTQKVTATGVFNSSAFRAVKVGTYTMTILAGKTKKVVAFKAR